jgi:ubiquinone/menaquinone biosynthesis C-methylase UbiE
MPNVKNTVENNLQMWNHDHDWADNGDEWTSQAKLCGKPYAEWKTSVIEALIHPAINPADIVLEVAPGHGRWTEAIALRARKVIVADLSPNCIDFCRKRFSGFRNIEYHVNNGRSLPFIPDASVDFIWSYDSFVHMSPDVIADYFREFGRILKPRGHALIHHAGRRHATLWLGFLLNYGDRGRRWYRTLSRGFQEKATDGWRSNVSRELVRQLAQQHGLRVEAQFQSWGPNGEYWAKRFSDCLTRLLRP